MDLDTLSWSLFVVVDEQPKEKQMMNTITEVTENEPILRPPTIAGRRRVARDWTAAPEKDDILDSLSTPVLPKPQNGRSEFLFAFDLLRRRFIQRPISSNFTPSNGWKEGSCQRIFSGECSRFTFRCHSSVDSVSRS
jgi:hypothetical protein